MNKILLKIEHLAKTYHGQTLFKVTMDKNVLSDVSFSIQQNEFFALIGLSGKGKSTIASIITGLESFDNGHIYLDDVPLKQLSQDGKVSSFCQMIFQDPMASLNPYKKIQFLLTEVLQLENKNQDFYQQATICLEQVGLDESFLLKYPHQLSGGEAQRVCIARALIRKPRLLICDEITSNLDRVTENEIMNLVNGLKENKNMSVLFITHSMALVEKYADRIGVLHNGHIVEQGPSDKICRYPQHKITQKLVEITRSRQINTSNMCLSEC